MDFKSAIEEIDEITRVLKVTIPAEEVQKELQHALDHLTSTTSLKGFRPGKAPRQLVEKMHGRRVRQEVRDRLISSSLGNLIKEHEIDFIGQPKLDIDNKEADDTISYAANFILYPRPKIVGYDEISVSVSKLEVLDEDVSKTMERFRESRATFEDVKEREVV
ncbi:MAG: hypothetical protein KDD53_13230, partial [Bdellovibrionales bacterium]|nr:hypothetical protein [Bdellovibrionales bacterium]